MVGRRDTAGTAAGDLQIFWGGESVVYTDNGFILHRISYCVKDSILFVISSIKVETCDFRISRDILIVGRDMGERPTQTRTTRYLETDKGKATLERKRKREQEKRKALAVVRRQHERRRRELTPARFAQVSTPNHIVRENEDIQPQCVQGGVPRWSESDLNPAYKKGRSNLVTLVTP
jgi:hypothetical protein